MLGKRDPQAEVRALTDREQAGTGRFRVPGPLGREPAPTTAGIARRLSEDPSPAVGGDDASVWRELEQVLLRKYRMPLVRDQLMERRGWSPEHAVADELSKLRTGSMGERIQRETFTGPKTFLRVISRRGGPYGEWWFDSDLLKGLEQAYSRIFFGQERREALRNMLREFLALPKQWNAIEEIWSLDLPNAETLVTYNSAVAPQHLFADLPLSEKGNRMLVGRARQHYIPVKDPLWITQTSDLLPFGGSGAG
jgi:hypothetical protein